MVALSPCIQGLYHKRRRDGPGSRRMRSNKHSRDSRFRAGVPPSMVYTHRRPCLDTIRCMEGGSPVAVAMHHQAATTRAEEVARSGKLAMAQATAEVMRRWKYRK